MNPIAKAVFKFKGDDQEQQAQVIAYEGAAWLVATWLLSHTTGQRYPERIVPMSALDPVVEANGLFRICRPLPRSLFLDAAPAEVLIELKAQVYNQLAHIPGPGSSH